MNQDQLVENIKTISLILGGLWVIYNYVLKRERYPKTEFTLDVKFIDKYKNYLILEFIANLENKGLVRQYIDVKSFFLKIRYITERDLDNDEITNHTVLNFKDENHQSKKVDFYHLKFPHSIKPFTPKKEDGIKRDCNDDYPETKEIVWLPKEWYYIFVDPGVKQKLSLPLSVPVEAKYILVKSEFKYKGDKKSGLHTAQCIFKVDDLIKAGTLKNQ